MISRKTGLLGSIALAVALAVGFALAGLLDGTPRQPSGSAVQGDDQAQRQDRPRPGAPGHAHEPGEANGILALTPRQIAAAGITLAAVGRGGGLEIRLLGRVEPAIDARAVIAAAVAGRIEQMRIAAGMQVAAGQALASLISGEAAALRARADAAAAEAQAASLIQRRDRNLFAQGVIARQEMEASHASSLAAAAALRAARAQLAAAGWPDAQGRLLIVSPMAGTMSAVRVAPGDFIASGSSIAEVLDPERAELLFTIAAALADQVRAGMRMSVTSSAASFEAEVLAVAPKTGQRSLAAVVRARPVSAALPPLGAPLSATIVMDQGENGLTVPADAVQMVNGQAVVFIHSDAGFRLAPVLPGRRAAGQVEILSGLSGAERIAAGNAFLLKAELAKDDLEHD